MKTEAITNLLVEILQYIILFFVIVVSAILFRNAAENLLKFQIILADGILYFAWGVWHHHSKNRLDMYILIEYGMVSALVIFLAAIGLGIVRFF